LAPSGTIYWSTVDGVLHATNPDGSTKWSFKSEGVGLNAPYGVGPDGSVYFVSQTENIYSVSPSGAKQWVFTPPLGVSSDLAAASDGTLYYFTGQGILESLTAAGSKRWDTPLGDTSFPFIRIAFAPDGTLHTSTNSFLAAIHPNGTIRWTVQTYGGVMASPAMAADGTLYVGSDDGALNAFSASGSVRWRFKPGPPSFTGAPTPAIGADGTIYFPATDQRFYALNSNGTKKWSIAMASRATASPAIALDGTIYVAIVGSGLYAVNPDGTSSWSYAAKCSNSSPAIAKDGTVYFGTSDGKFIALNPDGTKKFAFSTGGDVESSPAVAPDGTIYVGSFDRNLYAINPNGTFKWSYLANNAIYTSPAVAADGTIVFVVGGDGNGRMYALTSGGKLKWDKDGSFLEPAIASDGTIYTPEIDGIHVLNASGSERIVLPTNSDAAGVCIGADGTIYFGALDCNIYAIK
jgi:outer membrane protein assembly factor BamB